MFEFFKNLFAKINFKSEKENINKMNKIIYSIMILCAIVFLGMILYFLIKQWPNLVEAFHYYWNDSKSVFNH